MTWIHVNMYQEKMNPNALMSNILIISITFPVNNHIVHCSFIYLKNKANVDINT